MPITTRHALVVAGALLALSACDPLPTGTPAQPTTAAAPPAQTPPAQTAPAQSPPVQTPPTQAPPTQAAATKAASPAVAVNAQGPDLQLYSLPECSVVPGGALSGADALTIFVAVRNGGPGTYKSLVQWDMTSDTGLSGRGNTGLSTGSAFSPLQADLRPGDYGKAHRFTIRADPANQIVERSESNNTLTVTVRLPGRLSGAKSVPCTSP